MDVKLSSVSPDVDECNFEESCRRELGNVCVNTEGSYRCSCQHGFREVESTCAGMSDTLNVQNDITDDRVMRNRIFYL